MLKSSSCWHQQLQQAHRTVSNFSRSFPQQTQRKGQKARHHGKACLRCTAQSSSSEEHGVPEEDTTGSPAWHKRQKARTLPSLARTPEQTFVLAGILKIMLLSFTFPAVYVFKPLGYAPRGFSAYLVLIPVGIALSYLAKAIARSKFMQRRWSGLLIVLFSALLMTLGGYLYDYRPQKVRQQAPKVSQVGQESSWRDRMFASRAPKSGADSDKIWEELKKEQEGIKAG